MPDSRDNNHVETTAPGTAGTQAFTTKSLKRRIKLIVPLVLVVTCLLDWSRPPQRQISVTLYELLVIRGYRATFRHLTSGFVRCRMKPTCSQYSSEAVRKYGLPKGIWLTIKRFGRDMPWVPFGTPDPVP